MKTFLRVLAWLYTIVVGVLILWSWCAVLASLYEARELFTGPEWLLYVATLPTSHLAGSFFKWAESSLSWRFGDVVVLTVLGAVQVAALQLLAKGMPKTRRVKDLASAKG